MVKQMFKHECSVEHASKFLEWIQRRGGVAIWRSVNLANPGASWSTPALTEQGTPMSKPTWEADSKPEMVVTDAADIGVVTPKEVKRFHVAVRRSGNGLSIKLTDASSRRVKAAVAKAGNGAWYGFDYETQDAVIYVSGEIRSLAEWSQ